VKSWFRRIPVEHRWWILLYAFVGPALVNPISTGIIAWINAGHATVPLWAVPHIGGTSTITQTVGTLFILPFVTCLLCTNGVRQQIKAARLTPLTNLPPSPLDRLRKPMVKRAAWLGLATVVCLGPPMIVLLLVAAPHFTRAQFVSYACLVAVLLGFVITPIVALTAMTDPSLIPVPA
jgi:hypothetical protein